MSREKISELEFQIKILEQRGDTLSEIEILRLTNLREQEVMQKELGWVTKRTIPVKLLGRFKVPSPASQPESPSDNNNAKLEGSDKPVCPKKKYLSDKKKFQDNHQDDQSGIVSVIPSKTTDGKKKGRDLIYRRNQALVKKQETEEKSNFLREFVTILADKEMKLVSLLKKKKDLEKDILLAGTEHEVMTKMVTDLEEEEIEFKSKVKEALNHHKSCKK